MRHKSTAKNSHCQIQPETKLKASPERHLIEAAKLLVSAAETPTNLLQFFTHAINLLHNDSVHQMGKKPMDYVSSCLDFVDRIVAAWYDHPDEPARYMADGLVTNISAGGVEAFHDMCGQIMEILGKDYDTGLFDRYFLAQRLRILNALCLVVPYLQDYMSEIAKTKAK